MTRWFPRVAWRDIERTLLVVGVLGAFAASTTGEIAEELVRPDHALVEMHSLFAGISTWLYGALLVGELAAWLRNRFQTMPKVLTQITLVLDRVLCNSVLSRIIALAAIIAISVTGLLGGVMVYGTSADPIAGFVLKILGL